jgi:hypothetical protein
MTHRWFRLALILGALNACDVPADDTAAFEDTGVEESLERITSSPTLPGRDAQGDADVGADQLGGGGNCTVPKACGSCPSPYVERKTCVMEVKPCADVQPSDLKRCDECHDSTCDDGDPLLGHKLPTF